MTEDEMFGWHHRLKGHDFKKILGGGEGQGSPECCNLWSCKESDTTEQLLLLLLLSRFSRVRLCATPETAAHQAPPSLGFSRQEHWSGLPLPAPTEQLNNENIDGLGGSYAK